ncbi:MAG: M48 family metalloprotease [Hormoscilla sp. GUM202]|nr:M48 family metalloprotease [Hormoscilla sp. GUM202]
MLPDINNLRFPYERKLFMELQMNPDISRVLEEVSGDLNYTKRYLLGTAVKITETLIPELYQLYQTCLERVGTGLQGNLYVQQSSDYNAGVSAVGSRFDIVLCSAIVKDFQPQEIAFVIGHELGHVLFGHNQIPVKQILAESERLSYQVASLLFQWSRAAEISADRIGLLCSGSLASAANAFFKTSSGLCLDREEEIIRSLRSQYDEIASLSMVNSHESFCTHPLIPIRFKSLEMICLDIMAWRSKKSNLKISWAQIDGEIEEVLLKTEPLGKKNLHFSQAAVGIVMLSLLYIAVSDGELNKPEEYFIREIQQQVAPELNLQEILALCKGDRRKFSQQVLSDLSKNPVSRQEAEKILQLGYAIARCDRPLSPAETQAMEAICESLGCEVVLVHAVISQNRAIA